MNEIYAIWFGGHTRKFENCWMFELACGPGSRKFENHKFIDVCENLPIFAKICRFLRKFADFCDNLHFWRKFANCCENLQIFAKICQFLRGNFGRELHDLLLAHARYFLDNLTVSANVTVV